MTVLAIVWHVMVATTIRGPKQAYGMYIRNYTSKCATFGHALSFVGGPLVANVDGYSARAVQSSMQDSAGLLHGVCP